MTKDELARKLAHYIPEQAIPVVTDWLVTHRVRLKIAKSRKTKLGDYRPPQLSGKHEISINADLNPFAFLVTLTHEMAHLFVWEKYQNKVLPHGGEWKAVYARLLAHWLEQNIFPDDLAMAVVTHVTAPGASTCADPELYRALRQFNAQPGLLVEEVNEGQWFTLKDGRLFQRGRRRRTRFECIAHPSGKVFLVPAIMEATPAQAPHTFPAEQTQGPLAIGELPQGAAFRLPDGRIMVRAGMHQAKVSCAEPATGKVFLITPTLKVTPLAQSESVPITGPTGMQCLELLPVGSHFMYKDKVYKKREKRRTRVLMEEMKTGGLFLVSSQIWVTPC